MPLRAPTLPAHRTQSEASRAMEEASEEGRRAAAAAERSAGERIAATETERQREVAGLRAELRSASERADDAVRGSKAARNDCKTLRGAVNELHGAWLGAESCVVVWRP